MPRRLVFAFLALAVVAVVAVGVTQSPGSGNTAAIKPPSAAELRSDLAGSPAPLAALHAQANQLLDGGEPALKARLTALRAYPVVMNVWGSWCGPCRTEFPVLQRVAATYGRRVAFIGVDSDDGRAGAADFLRRFPVAYPSYLDPHMQIETDLTHAPGLPVTVFWDRAGHSFVHDGLFTSVPDLVADVERYALS